MNPNNFGTDYTADDSPQEPVRSPMSPSEPEAPQPPVSPSVPQYGRQGTPGQTLEPVIPPRYVPPAASAQRPQNPSPVPMPPPPPAPPSPTGMPGTAQPGQVDSFGRPAAQVQQDPTRVSAPVYETHSAAPSSVPDNLHLVDTPAAQTTIVSDNTQETHPPKALSIPLGLIFRKATKFVVFLGVIWAGAALLNAFVFQTYYVNGLSMLPTLNNSDRLVVSKVAKSQAAITGDTFVPERGEIIVIDSQVSTFTAARDEQIIKRVIGLPGERITIDKGKVTVFNESSPQGFDADKELVLPVSPSYTASPVDIVIPEDAVFVMGDNRVAGGSLDSRDFGPVQLKLIEGTLWVRILPFNQIHIF